MRMLSSYSALPRAVVFLSIIAFAGCAGMNDGEALDPTTTSLQGTWEYLVINAYEAEFTGCTGDATVLERKTTARGNAEDENNFFMVRDSGVGFC